MQAILCLIPPDLVNTNLCFLQVRNALADEVKKAGIEDTPQSVFAFLIDRVRNNLHVVLCMSPVGEPFRNRIRQYPAFVNCTTIDWFSEWPQDALLEVAERYLEGMKYTTLFSFSHTFSYPASQL